MLEVTVTVKATDNNLVATTVTKTAGYPPNNPLFYADATRQLGERLTNELADRLDAMYPQGDRPVGPATV